MNTITSFKCEIPQRKWVKVECRWHNLTRVLPFSLMLIQKQAKISACTMISALNVSLRNLHSGFLHFTLMGYTQIAFCFLFWCKELLIYVFIFHRNAKQSPHLLKSAFFWGSERAIPFECFPLHRVSCDCGVLWHFPFPVDCCVSLKGSEPFWDWCDETWQEIPLNKTNYTLEMCWTDWKQFGHQGLWKVLRRLRAMTFSLRFYSECFDTQLV